jgi:hypothetical protein
VENKRQERRKGLILRATAQPHDFLNANITRLPTLDFRWRTPRTNLNFKEETYHNGFSMFPLQESMQPCTPHTLLTSPPGSL